MWYVYIVECKDGSFYTGISTNVEQRIKDHDCGKGAKYTRGRGPVQLVYQCGFNDRAEASKEECRIKKLARQGKVKLIASARS